ncbi:MAG: Ni/Fe-hydrogenase, b-type cytochrome subunit [Propionibacteriaceae bacterium]|nr:Ni/Fe-hydrogenase, b-type cytochrome subunit [Propionibacteriaceae bacterium]
MTTISTATGAKVKLPKLIAGTAFTLGSVSEGRIMALAAASPPKSKDPVDRATVKALKENYPNIAVPEVDVNDVDPASLKRRYSLVRVRDCVQSDGTTEDLVVMRGDMDAVLAHSKINIEQKTILKKNAGVVIRHDWRPLVIASAPVENDVVGKFTVEGFIPVCPETIHPVVAAGISSGPAVWAPVRIWSASLRFQHWLNVAVIFILSCTGLFILDPFFGPSPYTGEGIGFLMGWVRLIHFTAAFGWLLIGLTRIWSAFMSRDRYLRWPSMWPLKKKEDVKNLGRILQHYTFIKDHAPLYLGHNPLQQLAYTSVYVACGLQMLFGFSLYSLYHQGFFIWNWLAIPAHWVGIPMLRLFHTMLMFLLWMFVIMHIYLVLRSESLERHGGLSAMINGNVWVKRGSQPVDAPMVE